MRCLPPLGNSEVNPAVAVRKNCSKATLNSKRLIGGITTIDIVVGRDWHAWVDRGGYLYYDVR